MRDRKNNTRDRLNKKLQAKGNAARDLSWQIIEIACKNLNPPLNGLINTENGLAQELALFRKKNNDKPKAICKILLMQLMQLMQLLALDENANSIVTGQCEALHQTIEQILNQLKDHKSENAALKIETLMFAYIRYLIDMQTKIISSNEAQIRDDENLSEKCIKFAEANYALSLFLSDNCVEISEVEDKIPNKISNPRPSCSGFYSLKALCKMRLAKDQFDEFEHAIKLCKTQLVNLEKRHSKYQNDDGEFPAAFFEKEWLWYYSSRSQVAMQKNDFSNAKNYLSKVARQVIKNYDLGYSIDIETMSTCVFISKLFWSNNDYEEALFFVSLTKDFLQKNMELFKHPENLNKSLNLNLDHEIASANTGLTIIKALRNECKKKISENTFHSIKLLGEGLFKDCHLTINDSDEYAILLQFMHDDQVQLFNEACMNKKLFCEMINDQQIIIYKPHQLSLTDMKDIINSMKKKNIQSSKDSSSMNNVSIDYSKNNNVSTKSVNDQLADNQQKQSTQTTIMTTTATTVATTTTTTQNQTKLQNNTSHAKEQTNGKTNGNKTNNSQTAKPPVKPKLVIQWDNDHIYQVPLPKKAKINRLYAPYSADRNFVCVQPELASTIYHTNKAAFWDLKSLCERGLVLGNSKGKKGFIIRSEAFNQQSEAPPQKQEEKKLPESKNKKNSKNKNNKKVKKDQDQDTENQDEKQDKTQYIKGKNSSHDWRFFGRIYKRVVMVDDKNNQKAYTLFQIDSWSQTHKQKSTQPLEEKTLKKKS